jgi:hypothetical protein
MDTVMRIDEIPISKVVSMWPRQMAMYTENFPEFFHDISTTTSTVRILHSDSVFLVLEENIPQLRVHGHFVSWNDVLAASDFLGAPVHMVTRFLPGQHGRLKTDPFLLYTVDHHPESTTEFSSGEIGIEEAAAFVKKNNPELFGRLLVTLIELSVKENLYSVVRNEREQIVFLHLIRKYGETFDGVYLWSSLSFSETARAYLQSVQRFGIRRMSSQVLSSNERSRTFHEFLGYRLVREHSFRITSER